MSKKKACKQCKIFVDGNECPLCHGSKFATTWHGRISFIDVNKSMIAEKMNIKIKGEYAIKVR